MTNWTEQCMNMMKSDLYQKSKADLILGNQIKRKEIQDYVNGQGSLINFNIHS